MLELDRVPLLIWKEASDERRLRNDLGVMTDWELRMDHTIGFRDTNEQALRRLHRIRIIGNQGNSC